MPNWCTNSVQVSHPNKEMMQKFADGVITGKLLETFIPFSSGEWDYGIAVEEWGTKWDITAGDFELHSGGTSGSGWYETAWSPPIAAYVKLKEQGFTINATYTEPGIGFCGSWDDGEEEYIDNFYNLFDDYGDDWEDQIDDQDLKESLKYEYENWLENLEEQKEDE
jgi:hypothetical protein